MDEQLQHLETHKEQGCGEQNELPGSSCKCPHCNFNGTRTHVGIYLMFME